MCTHESRYRETGKIWETDRSVSISGYDIVLQALGSLCSIAYNCYSCLNKNYNSLFLEKEVILLKGVSGFPTFAYRQGRGLEEMRLLLYPPLLCNGGTSSLLGASDLRASLPNPPHPQWFALPSWDTDCRQLRKFWVQGSS